VSYQPTTGEFFMTEEQAFCLADPNGPNFSAVFLVGLGYLRAEPRITEAFRTGAALGWHEHDEDVFVGGDAFFRPGYVAELVPNWIPALNGVHEKLTAGARVADVGCGLGSSSVLIAEAYPRATVVGSDYHPASIERAHKRAAESGVADRVRFEVATAQTFTGTGYDLVTTFDALHDMGDPVGAARHVREALAPDGTWLLVEPYASDVVEENFNPVGRLYYAGSTFLCVPNGLSQPGGYALGAQAGEAAIRDVVSRAGFRRFRRAAQTPFNLVFEIRPQPCGLTAHCLSRSATLADERRRSPPASPRARAGRAQTGRRSSTRSPRRPGRRTRRSARPTRPIHPGPAPLWSPPTASPPRPSREHQVVFDSGPTRRPP